MDFPAWGASVSELTAGRANSKEPQINADGRR